MHKEKQGKVTRAGAVIIGVIVALYSGFSWYRWQLSIEDASSASLSSLFLNHAFIGAIVIFLAISAFAIYLSFFSAKSSDFLIDVDVELRKVVWPDALPLFDPKAEAWGATYVVIVTVIFLTIYIGLVDTVLENVLAKHILQWLLA